MLTYIFVTDKVITVTRKVVTKQSQEVFYYGKQFKYFDGGEKDKYCRRPQRNGAATYDDFSLYHEENPNPSTKVVMKLCKYFEVTPNDFFGIKGERNYG